LLVRDVEAVVAAKREEEIVARDAGDLLRLEAEELADAVVFVHDEVAGAQVGERLQRSPADAPLLRHAATEDLVIREQDEPELSPHEAAAGGCDREQDLRFGRKLVAGLEHAGLDLAQHVLRAQRLAAMRERDDDALPRAKERLQLRLRLREAARRNRGPLRLECERLVLRERIELARALQADGDEAVLVPDLPHL